MIDKWEQDLRGLTDQGVRDRLELAQEDAIYSLRKGMGAKPKGRSDVAGKGRSGYTQKQAEYGVNKAGLN